MRKILVYTIVISLFATSCSSSKPIRKSISQKYYNLNFSPEFITKKSINKTDITITPVDAKSLNRETYEAAFRDGNYEKEFFSTIESWKSKLSSLSKKERILLQGKINAYDCLTKLESNGQIPINLSVLLKRKIVNETSGRDGTEVESLADIDISPSDYNPYKVNANYFSVFKLTFDNKGNDIEKINIKEFQLVSNEEQLYPLASDYFENTLKNYTETIKNSYRMNMPNELTITPGQRVSKYIAVPAINAENSKLQVQFIRKENVVNFDFNVIKKEVEKSYNLEKYSLSSTDEYVYKTFYVISYKDNVSYVLKDYELFVSDEKKSLQANIYALGINPLNGDIAFGTSGNFTFNDVKKNKRLIEIKKMKKDKTTGQY